MSIKEIHRRKILGYVMRKAWNIFRRTPSISFSIALKASWRIIRGSSTFFFSKIRGVSHENRQNMIKKLSQYPQSLISLSFKRDKKNLYDSNAIQIIVEVLGKGSGLIGYVSSDLACKIAPLLDIGKQAIVIFEGITGIGAHYKLLGVNYCYMII